MKNKLKVLISALCVTVLGAGSMTAAMAAACSGSGIQLGFAYELPDLSPTIKSVHLSITPQNSGPLNLGFLLPVTGCFTGSLTPPHIMGTVTDTTGAVYHLNITPTPGYTAAQDAVYGDTGYYLGLSTNENSIINYISQTWGTSNCYAMQQVQSGSNTLYYALCWGGV